MLRSLIVIVFVVIFLIISIPIWGILYIVGLFNKPLKDRIGFAIVSWAFSVVWHLSGVRLTVTGLERVPKDRPVLYVANHQSYFDVILAYSLCPTVTGFFSKKDFKKVPLLSVWMSHLYCIFLTRTDPREDLKLITEATEHMKNGISMFVFPEGTRSKDGQMIPFHDASLRCAIKSNSLIIPVAIKGTRDIFENHIPFIKSGKVTMEYMDAIDPATLEGENKKHPAAYVQGLIQEKL